MCRLWYSVEGGLTRKRGIYYLLHWGWHSLREVTGGDKGFSTFPWRLVSPLLFSVLQDGRININFIYFVVTSTHLFFFFFFFFYPTFYVGILSLHLGCGIWFLYFCLCYEFILDIYSNFSNYRVVSRGVSFCFLTCDFLQGLYFRSWAVDTDRERYQWSSRLPWTSLLACHESLQHPGTTSLPHLAVLSITELKEAPHH